MIIGNVESDGFKDMPWHIYALMGESVNDVWHMDNFSYGIDHFLIRIIPLKAKLLDDFQPLAEMSRVREKKKKQYREANNEFHKVIDDSFF